MTPEYTPAVPPLAPPGLPPWTQVRSDGVTVWVDCGPTTVARFGRMGIDVHTANADGCLHCTHEATDSLAKWREFVDAVLLHHNIAVGDEHMPDRVRQSIDLRRYPTIRHDGVHDDGTHHVQPPDGGDHR